MKLPYQTLIRAVYSAASVAYRRRGDRSKTETLISASMTAELEAVQTRRLALCDAIRDGAASGHVDEAAPLMLKRNLVEQLSARIAMRDRLTLAIASICRDLTAHFPPEPELVVIEPAPPPPPPRRVIDSLREALKQKGSNQ